MKTVRLVTCNTIQDAYEVKNRLEREEIPCILTNENITNILPHFNYMLGSGIQILVNENDLEVAQSLVMDFINPELANLVCPNCGSKSIKIGIGKRKRFKFLSIIISILAAMPFGNIRPRYYCTQCETEVA